MELSLPQLDFTISVNACHDQIMHKMEVLTNMEIELLRKFEHQVTNSEMHYKMIHDVRVLIINLEEIFKDVKQYFDQMGIKFVYDFFRKIQVLMVCGYNFLSQALLVNVDKIEDNKAKDTKKSNTLDCNVCKCTYAQGSKSKKREIKEVEHYDYKISMLQNEQQKITSQIHAIYEKIMIQKPMIEKTKPSLAIRQLEDMKQHIENVMQSTNSVFQETYMMKYVEFKNYLTQIKKPEDIVDYFIANMNFNMKEKFLKAMQKAIYKAQHMEEKFQRLHLKDVEVQTDKIKEHHNERQSVYRGFSLKPEKNNPLLTKQRKTNEKMVAELQYMRKQINLLTSQNNNLSKEMQKKQEQRSKYKQNFETLEKLYNKRSYELQITQSQNKWLTNQKQAEVKRLRHEIKELKKMQVQLVNQQTQVYISPNYTSTSTQTEIVHFQNQVENEIINVLKKSNEKMIHSLNEKQRKIRELITMREQYTSLKECKGICVGFLDDLREVTGYKMSELAKNDPKAGEKKKNREPIIPLNQNTSNNSIQATINKLTEQVKTLLLTYDLVKKKPNQKRASMMPRNSSVSRVSHITPRKSSKMSEISERSSQVFFKNTEARKSSLAAMARQTEIIRAQYEAKKSAYLGQYLQKASKMSSSEISQVDPIETKSQKKKDDVHQGSKNSLSSDDKSSVDSFSERIYENKDSISPTFEGKFSITINQKSISRISRDFSSQAQVQTENNIDNFQNRGRSNFHDLRHTSQQTDILSEQLTEFQKMFNLQAQKLSELKFQLSMLKKDNENQQINNGRKNPYIRKPGGRFTVQKMKSPQSDRNHISVNHSRAMNDSDISESIQQSLTKDANNQLAFSKTGSIERQSVSNFNKSSNRTLQSRLEQLISPKNNLTSSVSNLIVFKRSTQQYRKKTSQITSFQEIKKINKNLKQKQKQFTNTTRQQSLLIGTQNDNRWKEIMNKMDFSNHNEKQNLKDKPKHQKESFIKSKFVEKIIEQDSRNQSVHSNESTLIGVTKKSPQQRERKNSPNFELSENVFARTVRQMLMTSESKEKLMKRIEEIYDSMERQKSSRKNGRTLKNSFTSRDLRSEKVKNEISQVFKLGQMVQY